MIRYCVANPQFYGAGEDEVEGMGERGKGGKGWFTYNEDTKTLLDDEGEEVSTRRQRWI